MHRSFVYPPLRRPVAVKAKYGDESVYFDLNDLENSLGSWEVYGQDDKKRYPELQNEFFQRESISSFSSL
jgi:photosystem I subunit VI